MTRRRWRGPLPALAILVAVTGLGFAVLPAAAADKVIVVRAGDTLSEIAIQQGVSVAQLVALNGIKDPKEWPGSVQILEVTPTKEIVWALRSWDEPANFGPATTLQLLDEQGVPERGELIR